MKFVYSCTLHTFSWSQLVTPAWISIPTMPLSFTGWACFRTYVSLSITIAEAAKIMATISCCFVLQTDAVIVYINIEVQDISSISEVNMVGNGTIAQFNGLLWHKIPCHCRAIRIISYHAVNHNHNFYWSWHQTKKFKVELANQKDEKEQIELWIAYVSLSQPPFIHRENLQRLVENKNVPMSYTKRNTQKKNNISTHI